MSYILDALRKSDQQRQRGLTPTLASAPLPVATTATPRPAWLPFFLIGLGLLAMGITIGWLQPWQEKPTAAVIKVAPKPAELAVVQTPPTPAPQPAALAPQAAPAPITPPPQAMPEVAPVPARSEPARPVAVTAPRVHESASAPRPSLPKITITVHAYNETAAERVAGINGHLLREGEEIEPGFKLEKITKDGVTLNFKGQRFHREVQ